MEAINCHLPQCVGDFEYFVFVYCTKNVFYNLDNIYYNLKILWFGTCNASTLKFLQAILCNFLDTSVRFRSLLYRVLVDVIFKQPLYLDTRRMCQFVGSCTAHQCISAAKLYSLIYYIDISFQITIIVCMLLPVLFPNDLILYRYRCHPIMWICGSE